MSTVISGVRVKFGKTEGDVRVTSGGKLMAGGFIAGTLTVESGGYAYILGTVGGLVIEPGARAKLRGMCTGDVTNHGGDLTISGTVSGALYGKPIDPPNGEVMNTSPLPGADELARTVIDDLTHARWADVRARFDATMLDQLTEEELAEPWAQIPGLVSAYEGHGETDVVRAGDLTITKTPLSFEAGAFVVRVAFRDDRTIAGLYILNPDAAGGAGGSAAT